MGGLMAFVMTAIITVVNFGGIPDHFLTRWAGAFAMAWPIASFAAFFAAPLAMRITGWVVQRIEGQG
jgi:uncharacterized RDD family membrane protein YckC